jgi:hypothetical protein
MGRRNISDIQEYDIDPRGRKFRRTVRPKAIPGHSLYQWSSGLGREPEKYESGITSPIDLPIEL